MNQPVMTSSWTSSVAAILFSTLLTFTGCVRDSNKWSTADALAKPNDVTVSESGGATRIVLFAPTKLGTLSALYPDGTLEFPHKMANYIDLLVKEADGRVGESLPISGDAAWEAGRVPAAGGAHLVVLTSVVELRRFEGIADSSGRNFQQIAVVDLRAVDIDGRVVLNKQIKGQVAYVHSGKFSGPVNEPESLATWQALSTGCGLIKEYLDKNPDLRAIPKQLPVGAINMVEVTIDSEPSKADILVDGVFRGTTPQVIPLAEKQVTITIERQGYQSWSRALVPVAGMRIQPGLEPVSVVPVPKTSPETK
jgi:PEGA domain